MALGINTNLASLSAQRALNNTQADTNTAMQRLSTGLRINSAKDDAAGMAVASRFTSQISGMQQASRNASDAVSMLQSAEGGLQSITDNLQRIRELAVQAASDSITDTDRGYLNTEVSQLVSEIERVADTTKYNGTALLTGDYASTGLTFQVGADNTTNDRMEVTIADFQTATVGQKKAATTGALTLTGASANNGVTLKVGTSNAANIGAVSGNGLASQYKTAVDAVAGVSATVGSTVTEAIGISAFAANTQTGAGDNTTFQLEIIIDGVAADIIGSVNTAKSQADIDTAIGTFVGNDANLSKTGTAAGGDLVITDASGRDISLEATVTQTNNGDGSGGAITYDGSAVASGTATDKAFGTLTITTDSDVALVIGGSDETKIGATNDQSFASAAVASTGVDQIAVSSRANAQSAIDIVDRALKDVNEGRAQMGAFQSRFDSVVSNLNLGAENATAGRSRVQDADFAVESANLAKNQVLQQAGMSVLAQANALPQQVLALLQ